MILKQADIDKDMKFIRNWVDHVTAAKREYDLKWGHGRLIRLVDPKLRSAFDYNCEMFTRSVNEENIHMVADYGKVVLDGLPIMDADATKRGFAPIAPAVMECIHPDTGEVFTICRTDAELSAIRKYAQGELWSLEGVAKMIAKMPDLLHEVNKTFPGATVKEVRTVSTELHDDEVPF